MSDLDFEAKGNSLDAIPVLDGLLMDFAFKQAEQFIDCGQTAHEAGSIVANMFLRVAWIVAACGAEADGNTPDHDRFRARVEYVLSSVSFKTREERGGKI